MKDATAKRNAQLQETQPARMQNIAAIVEHLKRGASPASKRIGIELEHICVDADGRALGYSQTGGVRDALEALSERYPEKTVHNGDPLGVGRPGAVITLEPAAQVELSAGPFERLADAQASFEEFERDLDDTLKPHGGRALALGYDPKCVAATKELIPKARYAYMNRYLGDISPWGPRMMRGSASTQVSIDYADEADAINKMQVAQMIAPLLALICDNAPYFEGRVRPHTLMRTEIWKHCDPARCGTVPGALDPDFDFTDYAAFLLDFPAIVRLDAQGEAHLDTRTFGEIYAAKPMNDADVAHAMSMTWPDVRLKSYIEIRPADSMPVPYVIAYGALIKGIFYTPENLTKLRCTLGPVGGTAVATAKDELMKHGYSAEVYGHPAAKLCDMLIELGRKGLEPDEQGYIEPLAELVAARETLAERQLRAEGAK